MHLLPFAWRDNNRKGGDWGTEAHSLLCRTEEQQAGFPWSALLVAAQGKVEIEQTGNVVAVHMAAIAATPIIWGLKFFQSERRRNVALVQESICLLRVTPNLLLAREANQAPRFFFHLLCQAGQPAPCALRAGFFGWVISRSCQFSTLWITKHSDFQNFR